MTGEFMPWGGGGRVAGLLLGAVLLHSLFGHLGPCEAFLGSLPRTARRQGRLGSTLSARDAPATTQAPAISTPQLPERVPEILAPAGGREQFLAALNAGADAVFLGLKAFNARARAENFDLDSLKELVPLAHHYGMQVLVTVNVVIKEAELESLIETLSALEALEVDAVIVQDQAVGAIARRFFPGLRLHASTQMAVHNLAGVVKAASLGYRRVVLARELTAKEIKDIRAATPSSVVQLEAFCHGSLCYSYSGLCFFSGANDARSGNRGECAYTCRQPYELTSEPGFGFLFSMNDLDTSHDLGLLAESGVDTLKIEGRKKDAAYVSSTVRLYRRQLDQLYGRPTLRAEAPGEASRSAQAAVTRPEEALRRDLELSFHRGTTSFFVKGRYHENVIDMDNAGHLGVLAGRVLSVSSDLKHVRVAAEVGMERFDGLRIVPPARAFFSTPQHGGGGGKGGRGGAQEGLMYDKYSNDLPEFSLRGMRRGKAKVYEVEAGEVVEVELPAELRGRLKAEGRRIAQGDLLFKTRSNELKRRVEALAVVPQDYKPRQWDVLSEVRVALRADHPSPGLLTLQASAWKLGELVLEEGLELPLTPATREGARESLIGDIAEALGTFGDAGVRAAAVRVEGLPAPGDVSAAVPFVPRKELKALKQSIARSIGPALQAMLEGRREAAVEALVRAPAKAPRRLQPVGWGERRFAIKVDRFEYLEELERYLGERGEGARALIEEVVFEPKRMFLGETRGQEGAARLLEFSRRMGVGVRLALNTVVRAWDERPLEGWVRAFAEQSRAQGGGLAPRFETGNLGALGLLEAWGIMDGGDVDLATDFTMYALNSCASEEMARMGARRVALSVEDDRENLREHTERWAVPPEQARPQAIIFKDVPLFMAEACSLTALHGGCPGSKVCGYRTLEIKNPEGEVYEVAHEQCKSIVYAQNAFSLLHLQRDLLAMGVRDLRVDFLTRKYEQRQIWDVLDAALVRDANDAQPMPGTHTANFLRRLL